MRPQLPPPRHRAGPAPQQAVLRRTRPAPGPAPPPPGTAPDARPSPGPDAPRRPPAAPRTTPSPARRRPGRPPVLRLAPGPWVAITAVPGDVQDDHRPRRVFVEPAAQLLLRDREPALRSQMHHIEHAFDSRPPACA